MSEPTLPRTYNKVQADKLTEAVSVLRTSPAFKIVEQCLKDLLDQHKDMLVTNTSAAVPNLQGRAQQLKDIIEILNRKTS
jgi:hypothetical protein